MLQIVMAFAPLVFLILYALKTRKMADAMVLATLLAMVLLHRQHFLTGTIDAMYAALSNSSYQFALCVIIGFGGMITLFQESGALMGFRDLLLKIAAGPKRTLVLAWLMSAIMFLDEYLSALTVTFSMREITDKNRIPREHLALQANIIACCLCVAVPFSSWTAFSVGLISAHGLGFSDYVRAIPYMFYPLGMMLLCLLLAVGAFPKLGGLKRAYQRVQGGGLAFERDDTMEGFSPLADPDKITVVQVAPAVRPAWGEAFGLPREQATMERMAAALRRLGFDYVFDTDFAADLTIMEEGSEFIERFTHKDQYQWPMFTSCCPGWVRFVKSQYPELTDNLSTAKSPQQMFGAVAKSYFAEKVGIDPKRLFVVSIMPCVSKKSECALPTMKNDAGDPDVDVSITTRELNIMMRANHIEPKYLPEEEFDSPLGSATGAAVVFGTTGGVMDAALRSAYFLITGKNPDPDAFTAVRGTDGWKEATFNIPGAGDVRVAVVSSLGKARKLIEAVKRGDAAYDFVEVMACPGGCAGGGGQPIHDGTELAEDRGNVLWRLDQGELLRFSHENPDVKALYKDYLGAPLGEKSHHLLHTDHNAWQMPQKML